MNHLKRFFTNDNMMLVLVLINTGIIFVSGFWPNQGGSLVAIDNIFTILFMLEAIIKIQVQSLSGVCAGPDKASTQKYPVPF